MGGKPRHLGRVDGVSEKLCTEDKLADVKLVPFILDFPIKTVICYSYVKLPEGILVD